jgi:hypothetical protein
MIDHDIPITVSLGTLIAPGTDGLSDARGVAGPPAGDLYIPDFANNDIIPWAWHTTQRAIFSSHSASRTTS